MNETTGRLSVMIVLFQLTVMFLSLVQYSFYTLKIRHIAPEQLQKDENYT